MSACLPVDLRIAKHVVTGLERTYGWNLTKRLTNPGVQLDDAGRATLEYAVKLTEGAKTDAAWSMSGAVTIENPNRYKSVEVALADAPDIGGGAVCTFATGATTTLAAGETRAVPYTCSFASDPALTGTNTATVSWFSDEPGSDRTLGRQATAAATADIREADWNLTEFTKTVSVRDVIRVGGAAKPARDFGPYTWSAEGTEHIERYSVTITVPAGACLAVDNTATIAGLGTRASTQHTFCRQEPLKVSDSATASRVRVFGWSIAKELENRAGIAGDRSPDTVDAEYAVTVTEGGFADSSRQMGGTVRVQNPNGFRAFTVDVADVSEIDGVECRFDGPQRVLVPAGGEVRLPYRCSGTPAADAEHRVRVTGSGIDRIDRATAVRQRTTEVDRTVTVTDDRYAFDPAWRITWSAAGTEHRREYSIPVTTRSDTCQTFTNTASIGTQGPRASASFDVCAPRTPQTEWHRTLSDLANTGRSWDALLAVALLLLGGGWTFILLRRKRRT